MKQLFVALVACGFLFSFTKQKPFIPPGTIQITETLFADECEISNFSWQEYEFWTKAMYGKNSMEHMATLPDTTVWREKNSYNEPYVLYYYRHPAYKDYPVVGISYEQAQAFCKWRTERVKTFLAVKKIFKYQNFEYRLPTKLEWEKLAEPSANILNNNGRNEKGIYLLNCPRMDTLPVKGSLYDNADVTAPVKSYYKNSLGLYNILGNVAEMISEKGICKGGGWKNQIEECRIGKEIPYNKPNAWIGFRCVCEIKKKEI